MNEIEAVTPTPPPKPPGRPRSGDPLAQTLVSQFEAKRSIYSDPLLTLRDALPALGNVSLGTLRRLISEGHIRTWRASPRSHLKIRLSEVRRFVAAGDQKPEGDL